MKAEVDNLFYHVFGVLLAVLLLRSLRPGIVQTLYGSFRPVGASRAEELAGLFVDQRTVAGSEE